MIIKIINRIKRLFIYKSIIAVFTILKNYRYIKLFILNVVIKKKNIFPINGAIGHFPFSLYFCRQLYNVDQCIFFYPAESRNHNDYLYKKSKVLFTFDQRYQNVYEIMNALKTLTFGIYNFNQLPEHMNMGKKINFAQTFDSRINLFEFNDDENKKAESFLIKNNINKKNFICFIVRTAEYNKIYGSSVQARREDSLYKFRNVKPEAYIPALKYLVDSGNIVIRMGKGFSNPFPFQHDNFIDYAKSLDRSDFLDVWLSANCKFFFGTSNGIVNLPALFNKPYLVTNQFPIGTISSYIPKSIYLPSIAKKENQLLNLKEQVELDVIRQINGIYYDKIGIEVLENEPEDILNAVKDMENKIKNGFFVNDLNMKFWQNMKKEWNSELIPKNRAVRKKSFFEDFHKINGINATIPDFYLNKYSDLFLNY